jgi:hypothetical protein
MAKPTIELQQLKSLATRHSGKAYGKVLTEILPYAGQVVEWKKVSTSGSVVYFLKGYGNEFVVTYQEGNLANIVHELTHIAAFEGYDNDMNNYRPTTKVKPERIVDDNGHVTNAFDRQAPDMTACVPLGQIMSRVAAANTGSSLSKEQKAMVKTKTDYATGQPHVEFDTCVNHILSYMVGWGFPKSTGFFNNNSTGNALFRLVEQVALDRHNLRTGVIDTPTITS